MAVAAPLHQQRRLPAAARPPSSAPVPHTASGGRYLRWPRAGQPDGRQTGLLGSGAIDCGGEAAAVHSQAGPFHLVPILFTPLSLPSFRLPPLRPRSVLFFFLFVFFFYVLYPGTMAAVQPLWRLPAAGPLSPGRVGLVAMWGGGRGTPACGHRAVHPQRPCSGHGDGGGGGIGDGGGGGGARRVDRARRTPAARGVTARPRRARERSLRGGGEGPRGTAGGTSPLAGGAQQGRRFP